MADLGVVDLRRVRVEGAERTDRRQQHAHGVGVVPEALHERAHVLVDEHVVGDLAYPAIKLRGSWKLAVEQQVGDLEEGALLSKLLDGIPAVLQDACITVEERDRAAARSRVHKCRVVGHQPKIGVISLDLAQVRGADRAVGDRKLIRLTGPVVGDRERFRVRRLRRHPVCPFDAFAQGRFRRPKSFASKFIDARPRGGPKRPKDPCPGPCLTLSHGGHRSVTGTAAGPANVVTMTDPDASLGRPERTDPREERECHSP